MDFDFSITSNPKKSPSVALRAVYRVHADLSYDVRKGGVPYGDVVALRTLGGLGKIKIEGCDEIAASPGTLLFFEHNKVRRYYCVEPYWDFWWFEFSCDGVINVPLNHLVEINPMENETECFHSILAQLRVAQAGMAQLASSTFCSLYCRWLNQIEVSKRANPYQDAMEQAMRTMKQNLSKPVSIRELASMTGLCERQFRKVFLAIAGVQPKAYQENLRMEMAEELLIHTPFSIGEIAARLGYSSQFHFSKSFKSARGMAPLAFRRNYRFLLQE